jgi:hypothetical protein
LTFDVSKTAPYLLFAMIFVFYGTIFLHCGSKNILESSNLHVNLQPIPGIADPSIEYVRLFDKSCHPVAARKHEYGDSLKTTPEGFNVSSHG